MNNKRFFIPEHGGAGAEFIGVNLRDAKIFLIGMVIALISARTYGIKPLIFIGYGSYLLNKSVITWKKTQLPGFARGVFHRLNIPVIGAYTPALNKKSKVFYGDNTPTSQEMNRAIRKIIEKMREHGRDKES